MAIGSSGRIVIDLEPAEKKAIHAAVKARGMTLKEWFIKKAYEEFTEIEKLPVKSVTP